MTSHNPRVSAIKRGQRESLLAREISQLLVQASRDYPALNGVSITRSELSPDKGVCSVFFFSPDGEEDFRKSLEVLKLIKPSLRHALAQRVRGRYVPELIFKYDHQMEKQNEIESLFESLKDAGEL